MFYVSHNQKNLKFMLKRWKILYSKLRCFKILLKELDYIEKHPTNEVFYYQKFILFLQKSQIDIVYSNFNVNLLNLWMILYKNICYYLLNFKNLHTKTIKI